MYTQLTGVTSFALSTIIRNEGGKEDWELLCSTSEEWEELTESFRGSKQSYERSLFKVLNDELLPDILQMITTKVCSNLMWIILLVGTNISEFLNIASFNFSQTVKFVGM